jgi:hypothetical protein
MRAILHQVRWWGLVSDAGYIFAGAQPHGPFFPAPLDDTYSHTGGKDRAEKKGSVGPSKLQFSR